MKKSLLLSFLLIFAVTSSIFAQDNGNGAQALPDVKVESLDGKKVSATTFQSEDGPVIISFWATWCKPCIKELMAIDELYPDWQDEMGVKLVAISIDDARNKHKVAPFINGRGWDYDVYIDENWDLKRAFGVNDVPHTFIVNTKGEVVWSHNSYSPGDEEILQEILLQVAENGHPTEGH